MITNNPHNLIAENEDDDYKLSNEKIKIKSSKMSTEQEKEIISKYLRIYELRN